MIYDPARRAQELRHRILESMTAEEIEAYDRQTANDDDRQYGTETPLVHTPQ